MSTIMRKCSCFATTPLIIFNRKITTEHVIRNEFLDSQMDTAITYFNTNYNRAINVEEYASSIGMSISWFIRSFKNTQVVNQYNLSHHSDDKCSCCSKRHHTL